LATPTSQSVGTRSFYYATDEQIIRGEAKNGELADHNSPILGGSVKAPKPDISSR